MTATKGKQNYTNHIAMVLDMSGSMASRQSNLIKVVDAQIEALAEASLQFDQDTRITVYTFDTVVECVYYDLDVLRKPSIKDYYKARGMTGLISATMKAMTDLEKIPELYGDHAFMTLVFTDGHETEQPQSGPPVLAKMIRVLPENWTVAVMVPNESCQQMAQRMGFPADNIALWDASSSQGMTQVGHTIQQATTNFMAGRAQGIRGTKSLFTTEAVTAQNIKNAGLQPLHRSQYGLVVVPPMYHDTQISDFVRVNNEGKYKIGQAYYQLTKTEKIQGDKALAIVEKKTNKVFLGDGVRAMVNLPDYQISVKPDFNPDYEIYVQSKSVNRKIKVGTRVLILDV